MFYNQNAKSQYDAYFDKSAKANGLRYDFLRNIGQIESGYRADAKAGSTSATGVMQLIRGTGLENGLVTDADFLNPEKNINAGALYLGKLLKKAGGNEMLAGLMYHSGPASQDVKHFNAGEYDQISPAGQDYLRKLNGNAVGDPHATDHFNLHPMPTQAIPNSSLNQSSPKLDALKAAPQYNKTEMFQPLTQPVEGVTAPDTYKLPGDVPSQQEDDSFLGRHGFGFFKDTVNTAALNSEMNTITEAHNAGGWGAVGDLLHPARQLSKTAVEKVRASKLRPEYFSMINGATDDNIDKLITLAQEHQDREDDLATKKVGLGSTIGAGAVSLASDPTNLALMVQPEVGVPAFLEKLGGGTLMKWGMKIAGNAMYDATAGTLGTAAHTAITGGDFNAGDAAVSSVIIGAGFRGIGKAAGLGSDVIRSPEEALSRLRRTPTEASVSTSKPEGTVENGDVSQTIEEAPTAPMRAPETSSEGTPHEAVANRMAISESARTHGVEDPTQVPLEETSIPHVTDDGTPYYAAEPKEGGLTHEEDVHLMNGQRLDAGNPFNPHTINVSDIIDDAVNSGKKYRAAYSFGDAVSAGIKKLSGGRFGLPSATRGLGMNELAYEITREGIHPTARGYGLMLGNPATGLRDLGKGIKEGWLGQRPGKFTAQEIKEDLNRSDMNTLAELKKLERRMMNIPEYEYKGADGNPLSPKSDEEKLDMMRSDINRAIRAGDLSDLPPEMRDYAKVWRDHFNVDKANALLDPETAFAMPGAKPIISKTLADGSFLPAHYDRPAIYDVLENEFNGDKEAMQNALTEGDMDAYLGDLRVRKRVDDMLQEEHMSSDAIAERKREVNKLEKERNKAQEKHDRLNNQLNDLGDSTVYRETAIQNDLQKRGLGTPEEIQGVVDANVQKRMARFKTAPDENRIAQLYAEERTKLAKAVNDITKEVDRKARNLFSNLNRDIRTESEKITKRTTRIDDINRDMNTPLTKDQLFERAKKDAHDRNYGVVNEIDEDPDTLQAIERALDKNPVAGIANANSLKARSPFGYDGEIKLPNGKVMTKAEMLSNDHDRTFQLYNRQMNGHLAITGSTGATFKDFMTALNTSRKEVLNLGQGVEKNAQYLTDEKAFKNIDEMLKLIAGRARVDNPNGFVRSATKLLSTYSYATKNGWFGYDNIGEASALYHRAGYQWFKDIMDQGGIMPMLDDAKNNKAYANEIKDLLFGDEVHHDLTSTKENLRRGMIESGIDPTVARAMSTAQRGLTKGSEILPGSLMLHHSINVLTEMAEKQAIGSIVREVAEGKASIYLTPEQFRSAGLTPEQGMKIKELLSEHAKVDADGNVTLKDREKFLGDSRTSLLKRLTRRVAKDTLLLDDMGQTMSEAAGPVKQTLLMFKRFGMKAMNAKQMRSWHEAAGNGRRVEKALELAMSLGVNSFLNVGKVYARSWQMDDQSAKEYRDMMLSPAMFAFTMATRTPMLSMFGNASNIAAMMGNDWANNVRTTTAPNLPSYHQYEPQSTTNLLESVGGNVIQNIAGAQTLADIGNTARQAVRYMTSDNWKDHADAAYLLRDSMKRLTPMQDPLTAAIQRHMFEASTGLNWDKPNHK